MMQLSPLSEKFEAWLHDDDVRLVHKHMEIARIRKKSEFTRAALLTGAPRFEYERDWRVGELALAVNRLASIVAAGSPSDELDRVLAAAKRLTKALQVDYARPRRGKEGR